MMLPFVQCLSATRLNTNMTFDMMEFWMKGISRSMEMVARRPERELWISNCYRSANRATRQPGCCTAALFLKEGIILSEQRPANRQLVDSTGNYQQ